MWRKFWGYQHFYSLLRTLTNQTASWKYSHPFWGMYTHNIAKILRSMIRKQFKRLSNYRKCICCFEMHLGKGSGEKQHYYQEVNKSSVYKSFSKIISVTLRTNPQISEHFKSSGKNGTPMFYKAVRGSELLTSRSSNFC